MHCSALSQRPLVLTFPLIDLYGERDRTHSHQSDLSRKTSRGEHSRPLLILRKMLQDYPDNPDILNMMGLLYLAKKNPKAALPFLKESYEVRPTIATALNQSSALIALKRYASARDILLDTPGIENYVHTERIFHNIALTYHKEGDKRQAIAYYQQAVGRNPSYYLSYMQLAKLYESQGNTEQALENYKKTLNLCGSCYDALKSYTKISLSQKQQSNAIMRIKEFLKSKMINKVEKRLAQSLLKKVERETLMEK